ncbi:MAG: YihY/virulence factor BrkB family protein [Candidatus Latescibacterota bacterium]|nr:MAG: YihY/virulence factor BrkB family protein [Candidatus Latescibacterota bacterium]
MSYRDYWKRNWIETLRRVWSEMLLDDCFGASAQLAYYFLLAFFPFVMFLVALVAYLPLEDWLSRKIDVLGQMEILGTVMPPQAMELVRRTADGLSQRNTGALSISALGALVVASNGMRAVMVTLNRAYSVREGRPLWYRYVLAVLLTLALVVTVIVAAVLLSLSEEIGERIAVSAGAAAATSWRVASQVAGLGSLLFITELIYHVAPNVRRPWHWITPGSIVAVLLWLLGIQMFTAYVSRFGRYEVMYAGLGAVVVFLLWLYIAGLSLLVGGELNAELERSTGLIPQARAKAPRSVDAAGHDRSVRDTLPRAPASR